MKIVMTPMQYVMLQREASLKKRGLEDKEVEFRNEEKLRLGKEKTDALIDQLIIENEELRAVIEDMRANIQQITENQIKNMLLDAITSDDLPTEEI